MQHKWPLLLYLLQFSLTPVFTYSSDDLLQYAIMEFFLLSDITHARVKFCYLQDSPTSINLNTKNYTKPSLKPSYWDLLVPHCEWSASEATCLIMVDSWSLAKGYWHITYILYKYIYSYRISMFLILIKVFLGFLGVLKSAKSRITSIFYNSLK